MFKHIDHNFPLSTTEGGIAFWQFFRSVFRFLCQKTSVFRFWCSLQFMNFPFFSIWFSVFAKNSNGFSDLISGAVFGFSYLNTGGSTFSCEMILLQDNSHGEIKRVCMRIFTTALRNKKISQILTKNTSPYFPSTLFFPR